MSGGHGYNAYRRNKCRCDVCREAHREQTRIKRIERLNGLGAPLVHGSRAAYDCGCRCPECLGARKKAYERERRGESTP